MMDGGNEWFMDLLLSMSGPAAGSSSGDSSQTSRGTGSGTGKGAKKDKGIFSFLPCFLPIFNCFSPVSLLRSSRQISWLLRCASFLFLAKQRPEQWTRLRTAASSPPTPARATTLAPSTSPPTAPASACATPASPLSRASARETSPPSSPTQTIRHSSWPRSPGSAATSTRPASSAVHTLLPALFPSLPSHAREAARRLQAREAALDGEVA